MANKMTPAEITALVARAKELGIQQPCTAPGAITSLRKQVAALEGGAQRKRAAKRVRLAVLEVIDGRPTIVEELTMTRRSDLLIAQSEQLRLRYPTGDIVILQDPASVFPERKVCTPKNGGATATAAPKQNRRQGGKSATA